MSSSTARDGSRSASDETRLPVSISPPSDTSSDAIASVMVREPPAATGQPVACPSSCSTSANAAVPLPVSGCMEWAAFPATSARAAPPLKRRVARPVTERIPSAANRAAGSGCLGTRTGPSRSPISGRQSPTSGSTSAR